MQQPEYLEAINNGIDVLENLANGDQDNGAGAYWEDAEEFFREAEWSLLQDLTDADRWDPFQ